MGHTFAISWNDSKKGIVPAALAVLVALSMAVASSAVAPLLHIGGRTISVIVRELPGSGPGPERTVESIGGNVGDHIELIDGFVADLPEEGVPLLRRTPGIHSVTPNGRVQLLSEDDGYNPADDPGSMLNTTNSVKAPYYWHKGFTGQGVTVAMVDSGVVPVGGLTTSGKVINGADLSFESQAEHLRYLDTFGHGTHMAGIIAGREEGGITEESFAGVAPDARVLSVKVANANGAADVSQVLAAIDWVVQHRNDNGMNVRVLNLSFGTDGTQAYTLDPLAYAAEVAWHRGIVVVVAGGNEGFGTLKLNNPAHDPYVIAVGASDTRGTYDTSDDTVPAWSSKGDGARNPDLVAPGKSIVSLRAPGSNIDLTHPEGRVGDRFFRGSGTSQAAAVVSGAAALIVQQRPSITPDQVKALMMSTATPMPAADPVAQGEGVLNLLAAFKAPTPSTTQTWPRSTGTGSLELARGSGHIVDEGGELRGEIDIFGNPWDGQSWSGQSWSGQAWSGGLWNGQSWSGQSWSGQSWSGQSWSGQSWSGQSWSGQSWSGQSWSGQSWSGQSWSGQSWSGQSWSGQGWSGAAWGGDEYPAPMQRDDAAVIPTEEVAP
jgi:subtilisin family serine protease